MDFGTSSDLHRDELELDTQAPGIVMRCVGMAAIAHIWGGVLAGIPFDMDRAEREYQGATQGSLVIAFHAGLCRPANQFKREIDEYARAVRQLAPIEGIDECNHAGGIEAIQDREYRKVGVPVSPDHLKIFADASKEYGVPLPW